MSEAHEETGQSSEEVRRPPPGLANGAESADVDVPDSPPAQAPTWREDWRAALAAGDEKRARILQRYATPENWAKASFEARDKISRGVTAADPPEDLTEVELKAWRKEVGIPEAAEGYQIDLGETAGEVEKAELAEYLKYAHEKNLTPRAVKESVEWWKNARAAAVERAAEVSERATIDSLAEARQAFPGREWRRMFGSAKDTEPTGLANDFINNHFEGQAARKALDDILNAKLPSGVRVADDAHFLKAIASMARAAASEDDLVSGDVGGGSRSVDEEFRELAAKPRLTAEERGRMERLAEARMKREERMAR